MWHLGAINTVPNALTTVPYLIEVDNTSISNQDYGTFASTAIDRVMIAWHQRGRYRSTNYAPVVILNDMRVVGGYSTSVASMLTAENHATSYALLTVQAQSKQSINQFFCCQNIRIGNAGGSETYWESAGQSVEYPGAYSEADLRVQFKISSGLLGFYIDSGASDTVLLDGTSFNMGDFHEVLHCGSARR